MNVCRHTERVHFHSTIIKLDEIERQVWSMGVPRGTFLSTLSRRLSKTLFSIQKLNRVLMLLTTGEYFTFPLVPISSAIHLTKSSASVPISAALKILKIRLNYSWELHILKSWYHVFALLWYYFNLIVIKICQKLSTRQNQSIGIHASLERALMERMVSPHRVWSDSVRI